MQPVQAPRLQVERRIDPIGRGRDVPEAGPEGARFGQPSALCYFVQLYSGCMHCYYSSSGFPGRSSFYPQFAPLTSAGGCGSVWERAQRGTQVASSTFGDGTWSLCNNACAHCKSSHPYQGLLGRGRASQVIRVGDRYSSQREARLAGVCLTH